MKTVAGRVMEFELKSLEKSMENPQRPSAFVLGGAKPEDNIKLLKGNNVLACGLFGQTCLIAKGKNLHLLSTRGPYPCRKK